jgi:hypothetical protein
MKLMSLLVPVVAIAVAAATSACSGSSLLPTAALDDTAALGTSASVADTSIPGASASTADSSTAGATTPADPSDQGTAPSAGDAPVIEEYRPVVDPCNALAKISLETLTSRGPLMVRATYQLTDPNARQTCGAPAWTVSPSVDIVATRDPFVIVLSREETHRQVVVTAEAPNGVREDLTVRLH